METYSYFESAMDWLKVTSPIVAWIALFLSLIDTPGYKAGVLWLRRRLAALQLLTELIDNSHNACACVNFRRTHSAKAKAVVFCLRPYNRLAIFWGPYGWETIKDFARKTLINCRLCRHIYHV